MQEILDQRKRQGDRDIVHFHYLKGIIYCGKCWDAGRHSRLLYSQAKGNGGTYEYFLCTAKQRSLCSTPAIPIKHVEAEVARAVAREQLTSIEVDAMRDGIAETIDDLLEADKQAKAALRKQLIKLEAQEDRLIELAADGTMAVPKLRAKLEKTTLERAPVAEQLDLTTERLHYGSEKALAYIELLRAPGAIYDGAADLVRRDLLGALFDRLLVYVDEDGLNVNRQRTEANGVAHEIAREGFALEESAQETTEAPRGNAKGLRPDDSYPSPLVRGLSKTRMAGMVTVLSNLSDGGLTPDGLRSLAHAGPAPALSSTAPRALRAHKLERRLSKGVVGEIVRRYKAGESATALAEAHGVAPSALLRLFRAQGVEIRRHGLTSEQDVALAREYERGATMAELEARYKLSHSTVGRALVRAGATLRRVGRP